MLSDPGIHYTSTTPIDNPHGAGWEFTCPECGYHAQYYKPAGYKDFRLEILNAGAPHARHVSSQGDSTTGSEWAMRPTSQTDEVEEQWLPPHLRRQIEEILKKFDVNKGSSGHLQ